jgi:capsular polysaccharide export protein
VSEPGERDRPALPLGGTVAIFSAGMARIPHLAALVGADRVVRSPDDGQAGRLDAVLGWGEKPTAQVARAYAARHRLPLVQIEDGFLRSVGLGVAGEPPLSVVLDDVGIYYDARRPSRLERLLAADGPGDPLADPALLRRAAAALDRIRAARLSKYNDAPPGEVDLGPPRPRVLVVDQTAGDQSVACGLADRASFAAMLAAARAEHPDAEIVVKTHPDVVAGKKRGYLEAAGGERVRLWARPVPPLALLAQVDRVYTVTSQLGFEALVAGKPVTCFGAPFYAGWGLTDDRVAAGALARRGRRRSVDEVFAAAYLLYARYVDPDTGAPCELERVIEHLALQRAMFEQNQGVLYCVGFQFWKRRYVQAYLRCPGNRVVFATPLTARRPAPAEPGPVRVVEWGDRGGATARALAARHGVDVWRMEDGFVRSVGLGSDLVAPASLVLDRSGVYYDPSRPSDLERILETADFSPDELSRAGALREAIVSSGLSKYNVGDDTRLATPAGRRVVLVPGQVEDDASIRLGCRDVRTNLGLLEAARRARPDAHLIYKPHPDVLSGNRRGAVEPAAVAALGAAIEERASLAQCLRVADEVHTLTSLVGFEALLRDREVVVYGQPFYSGWGLTADRNPHPRRTRRRTIDELVAGAFLRYPRYLNRRTGRFTTAEVVVALLREERDADAAGRTVQMSWPRRQLRKLVQAYRGLSQLP